MKLRLLWCSEASFLSTGYAVQTKAILDELAKNPNIDILEHANYAQDGDARLFNQKWKIVPNAPHPNNREEQERYNSNQLNVFGAYRFEGVVSAFKPHVVMSHLDSWMMTHQLMSPLRKYYHLIWQPAVDAESQNREWLDKYAQCNAIFSYTNWAKETLEKESGGYINVVDSAPGGTSPKFKPIDGMKAKFGLENYEILGFVARNQRRKLFDDICKVFREYLDKSGKKNVLLYLHTTYPDNQPWHIPELISKYQLSNNILLTYKCDNCKYFSPSRFLDYGATCPKCGSLSYKNPSVKNGLETEELCQIYNVFDFYVQYANSEGLGIPQLEAAACAIPFASVDYSSMGEVVRHCEQTPIPIVGKYKELETGCYRAVPDNEATVEILTKFFNMPEPLRKILGRKAYEGYHKYYGFDKAAEKYIQYFNGLNIAALDHKWKAPMQLHKIPALENGLKLDNADFVNWLIRDVAGQPQKIGTHLHLTTLQNITFNCTENARGPYSREQAYNQFRDMGMFKNFWEQRRCE